MKEIIRNYIFKILYYNIVQDKANRSFGEDLHPSGIIRKTYHPTNAIPFERES
jgi:hypothetical protein